uniref:Uncharacterized protein n=1 Tax=viral metagenome TaxID=1070528 RepID=A0A6M3XB99_9ZZZZ
MGAFPDPENIADLQHMAERPPVKSELGPLTWCATSSSGECQCPGLVAERDRLAERVKELETERTAYKRDLQAELDGAGKLRDQYGARDGEGFGEFVGRLAARAAAAEAELAIERACSLANAAELLKADGIIGELREQVASRAPAEPGPYRQCVDCGAEVDEGEPHECAQPEPQPAAVLAEIRRLQTAHAEAMALVLSHEGHISLLEANQKLLLEERDVLLQRVRELWRPTPAVPDSASLACRQDCDAPFLRNGKWCVSMATRHERGCLAECLEYLATAPIPAVVLANEGDVPFLLDLQTDLRDGKVITMRREDDDTEAYLRATILPRAEVVELVRVAYRLSLRLGSGRVPLIRDWNELRNALTPALRRLAEEGS